MTNDQHAAASRVRLSGPSRRDCIPEAGSFGGGIGSRSSGGGGD